jgi:hypothetical protein
MSLSKTAKRFLSSTMAIALAGGSVLAFGSSSFATGEDGSVGFEGTVNQECILTSAAGGADTQYTSNGTADTTLATELTADDTVTFDCNAGSVDVSFTGVTFNQPSPVGGGASNLTSTHEFTYGVNSATAETFDGSTTDTKDTDADGDLSVVITSKFTATGNELLAGTYDANATINVVAK